MKKPAAAALIAMTLVPLAHSEDLWIFERQPNQNSAIHRGLANGVPVLINIYGQDQIQAARQYGKALVGHHSFTESKQLIQSKAEQLYRGQGSLVRWFEQDAAQGYDQQTRIER